MQAVAQKSGLVLVLGIFLLPAPEHAQAPLPAKDLPALTHFIQRDFASVDERETIGMTDESDDRFDIVVTGTGSGHREGWRVEVFTADHHRVRRTWDSRRQAAGEEFDVSGSSQVDVRTRHHDYDILIRGCARHLCAEGVEGFLVYSGQQQTTYKAKVVTRGLDKPISSPAKYDVTFTPGIAPAARKTLEEAICTDIGFTNKSGFPFECKAS